MTVIPTYWRDGKWWMLADEVKGEFDFRADVHDEVRADRNRLREALLGLLGIINPDDDDDHVRRVSRGADCECWPCQAAALAGAGTEVTDAK